MNEHAHVYDYLTVGAGPAGLAFASTIKHPNSLVIDLGKLAPLRDRNHSVDCAHGYGGAGLFSDGKFSFYPSGSGLWKCKGNELRMAYRHLEQDLGPYCVLPPFPQISAEPQPMRDLRGWSLKPYPSVSLDISHRMRLIQALTLRCPKILHDIEFSGFERTGAHYLVHLKKHPPLRTRTLVLAGGRFMPLFLNCSKTFHRYEFGFRIQGPSSLIKKESSLLDPKYILQEDGVQYRTFCWCENGEVVQTTHKSLSTYSGRSDCPATGLSNFGYNVRIQNDSMLSEADFALLVSKAPFKECLPVFLENLHQHYSGKVLQYVRQGIGHLMHRFPWLQDPRVHVIGPTIEGVGAYPRLDPNFQLLDHPGVYAIGDCSGTYRGIVACMLAGYYLAHVLRTTTTNERAPCAADLATPTPC